jgi:ATP-dependent Clp protease ATP-binding subunit ClpC
MPAHHYPILVWPDSSGSVTAALAGDLPAAAAYAPTEQEALRQLKELLEWRLKNEPWEAEPDFAEPVLNEVKVEVRPQYREGKRIIPCPETIWLRVPCVTGLQESGMRLCVVPHLGVNFNYHDAEGFKGLAAHYVKEALQGLSPAQLAGVFPPRGCRLAEITVRDPGDGARNVPPANRPELKLLFAIANPLLHDVGRRRPASAAYGRETLSAELMFKLAIGKGSFLLVGESGVGKSTLLRSAAKGLSRMLSVTDGMVAISADDEDEEDAKSLRTYRLWRGSGGRLIAGMRFLGEWEERCEQFIAKLNNIGGIFCAESLLELVQVGGQDPVGSVAAFLLPYLQRGELRMVTEATPSEVEACRRLLPGLVDVFQIVQVPTFNDQEALNVLTRLAAGQAAGTKRELQPRVTPLVHRLFKRFMPYAPFPGRAAAFIRALFDPRGPARDGATAGTTAVTTEDVISQFVRQTGLPEMFLRDDMPMRLDAVQQQFAAQIIGQPDATAAAARLVTTIKAGLANPGRPLGVLLFCGPTGVGKTALAKALADFCFGASTGVGGGSGQKDRLVRLDMSEYSGWGAGQRLLNGSEGRPALWIERLRQQPFCVLLFDEIEKAAPEVFDLLLGVLDEGRLTDRFGRVTTFRSAIIILTSNLGSTVPASSGFSAAQAAPYEAEVARFFRPEFFNRLDAVITFRSLAPADIESITRKELADLAKREGFASAGLKVTWSDRVVAVVSREGYDHRFGARPLQRALERIVVTPLAHWRVENPGARNLVLELDLDAGGVTVRTKNAY